MRRLAAASTTASFAGAGGEILNRLLRDNSGCVLQPPQVPQQTAGDVLIADVLGHGKGGAELLGGVAKGAFTDADAEAKFNKWVEQKEGKIAAKTNKLSTDAAAARKAQLAAEAKVKEERAAALAEKKAAEAAAAAAAEAEAAAETAEQTTEAAAE